MIHVENITINIQPTGAEAGPTSVLGDALMKAMAEASLQSKPKKSWGAKGKCNHPATQHA